MTKPTMKESEQKPQLWPVAILFICYPIIIPFLIPIISILSIFFHNQVQVFQALSLWGRDTEFHVAWNLSSWRAIGKIGEVGEDAVDGGNPATVRNYW